MHPFVRSLITEWRRLELPFSDAAFVVAVSGGADSVSLLLALNDLRERKKLGLRLVAGHFNHRLRGDDSDRDEEFVRHLAGELKIELALGHSPIKSEGNLEQNARNSRYAFLKETAQQLNAAGIITAHTVNDQAETFLLNLLRGSGLDGLGGMKAVREFEKGRRGEEETGREDETGDKEAVSPLLFSFSPLLIRPLLTWAKREDTENYCREMGVEYRYDTMNEDLSFKRVRIRKILLPTLADFNPKIVETLANTAALLRMASERLHSYGDVLQETLAVADLKTLEKSELLETIRAWLGQRRGNLRSLELKHIEAVERLINSGKSGKTVELPGCETVVKHAGRLVFAKKEVDK